MSELSLDETIVLFKGQSQYDVLRHFIDDIAFSFRRLGFKVEVVDLLNKSWIKDIEQITKKEKIGFFFSFNAMGIDITVGKESLYDILNAPLVAFMVDHPMYHINRLNTRVNNLIVSYVDKEHLLFLTKYMKGPYSKVFIPHGAPPTIRETNEVKPLSERKIDVFFPGSYHNPEKFREQWRVQKRPISQLFDEIMEKAYYCFDVPLMTVAEKTFIEKGIDQDYFHHGKLWELLINVDMYLRFRRRLEIIDSISGLPIQLYGNGWESVKLSQNHIKINQSITYSEVQEKMLDSKFVLTVNPSFINGGHERVFSTMVNGAVSLVNNNQYLRNTFDSNKNILLYDFDKSIEEIITKNLSSLDSMQTVASQGMSIVSKEHTWLNRIRTILDAVYYHKYFII